jgi:hypothetical protein
MHSGDGVVGVEAAADILGLTCSCIWLSAIRSAGPPTQTANVVRSNTALSVLKMRFLSGKLPLGMKFSHAKLYAPPFAKAA